MYTDTDMKKFMESHIKGGAFKSISSGCWDAELEVIDTTNKAKPVAAFKINIQQFVKEKIEYLMKKYPSTEWLAYLVGEKVNDNDYLVTDLIIPKQTVTGVNVYDVKYNWNESDINIIGVIHSHHSMGAFFSGTDDAYINQNHDISIVVSTSTSSSIESQLRIKVSNDRFLLITPTVVFLSENLVDEAEFKKEIEDNISSPAPVVYDYTNCMSRFNSRRGAGGASIANQAAIDAWEEEVNKTGKLNSDDAPNEDDFYDAPLCNACDTKHPETCSECPCNECPDDSCEGCTLSVKVSHLIDGETEELVELLEQSGLDETPEPCINCQDDCALCPDEKFDKRLPN
jgi:hypothetical protein